MNWIDGLGKVYKKQNSTYFIEVSLKDLDNVWPKLMERGIDRISSITVNELDKELEIIYHFVQGSIIINIKSLVPKKSPQVKSVVDKFPGAELIEREIWETMGVEPVGHPNLKHLLLDEKLSPKTPGLRSE